MRPACFWPDWHYFSRFTPPGPRKTLIIVGHAPLYLIPFFIRLLIYRTGYIWFSSFIISFIVILLRATVHARFIQLLNCMIVVFSHFTCTFFYCVYNSYTLIRSFAALQHLNFAGISLEFYTYWHMLPGLLRYQWIFFTYHMDLWKYHTYHTNGKPGFTGFNDAYHCMLVIALACCALWLTCDCWNSMGYTNCVHTFSPH